MSDKLLYPVLYDFDNFAFRFAQELDLLKSRAPCRAPAFARVPGPQPGPSRYVEVCEKCGAEIRVGMWPFCHGDPKEHGEPRYGWRFA